MKNLKLFFSIFSLALVIGSISYAGPCDDDVDKYCGNMQPGMGDIASCMDSHKDNLSYQCKEWIKSMDHALRKLKDACSWSARDFCRDVKPGYGRVVSCLKSNYDKLPPSCQEALNATGH